MHMPRVARACSGAGRVPTRMHKLVMALLVVQLVVGGYLSVGLGA